MSALPIEERESGAVGLVAALKMVVAGFIVVHGYIAIALAGTHPYVAAVSGDWVLVTSLSVGASLLSDLFRLGA